MSTTLPATAQDSPETNGWSGVGIAADVLLIDLATGRYTPGDVIDDAAMARELGVNLGEVRRSIDVLCRIGVLLWAPFGRDAVVGLPAYSVTTLLRRLGGAMELALARGPQVEDLPEPRTGLTLGDRFGLELPLDIARLVELTDPLFGLFDDDEAARLEREVVGPLSVLASVAALRVHDSRPALSDDLRARIVDEIEAAVHYGEWRSIPGLMADFAIAFAPDKP
jgi:hypothetical protein